MEQLAWLPAHSDFAGALKWARQEADAERRLSQLLELCGYRRDFVATEKLDRSIGACLATLEAGASATQLQPARLAILSSHTVDHVAPAIRIAALGRRIALSTHVAGYGLYRQALMDGERTLSSFAPQFLLLALDAHEVQSGVPLDASEQSLAASVDKWIDDLRILWRAGRQRYNAQIIQQTFVDTAPSIFGSYDGLVPGSPRVFIERLNDAVRSAARAEGVLLLDIAWLGRQCHGEEIGDPVRWHQAKQLIAPQFAPQYGDWAARIVAASLGLSRKCLVLDLDNTLWGGVIGDDGLDGIRIGQGDPLGEAFLAFQHYAAALGKRGMCSPFAARMIRAVAERVFSRASRDGAAAKRHRMLRRELGATRRRTCDASQANSTSVSTAWCSSTTTRPSVISSAASWPSVAVPELPDDPANYAREPSRRRLLRGCDLYCGRPDARAVLPGQRAKGTRSSNGRPTWRAISRPSP